MAKIKDRAAFVGETLTGVFAASPDATAVNLLMADCTKTATAPATKNGDNWEVSITPAELSGSVRWFLQVHSPRGMGVEAHGEIYLKPLVSKYRAVVAEIENALKNWGNNPNKTISVGEMSITYKDRDELLGLLSYWRNKAEADENGRTATSGPLKIKGGF